MERSVYGRRWGPGVTLQQHVLGCFGRNKNDKLRELGHLPFRPQQPNGWSDFEEDWISPELIIRRLILALKLADYGIKRDYNFIKTVVEKNFDEPDKINQLIEKQNKNFFGNIFATICNSPEMLKA